MTREELLTTLETHGPTPELLAALEDLPCCPHCGPYDRCTGHWDNCTCPHDYAPNGYGEGQAHNAFCHSLHKEV